MAGKERTPVIRRIRVRPTAMELVTFDLVSDHLKSQLYVTVTREAINIIYANLNFLELNY